MREFDEIMRDGYEKETQEKLNISGVKQRFIERRDKLQREYEYFITGCNRAGSFNDWAREYYKRLPTRILELDYLLEHVL